MTKLLAKYFTILLARNKQKNFAMGIQEKQDLAKIFKTDGFLSRASLQFSCRKTLSADANWIKLVFFYSPILRLQNTF